jgi:hypothetical protein
LNVAIPNMKSFFAVIVLTATLTSAWQVNIGSTRAVGNQGWPCQSVRGGGRREERERGGNTFYDWDPTAADTTTASAPAPNRCCLLLFDQGNCYHSKGTAFERQCNNPYSGQTPNMPGTPVGVSPVSFDIKAFEVFCYDRASRN